MSGSPCNLKYGFNQQGTAWFQNYVGPFSRKLGKKKCKKNSKSPTPARDFLHLFPIVSRINSPAKPVCRHVGWRDAPKHGCDGLPASDEGVWLRACVMRFNQANERRVCAKLLMVSGRVVKVCGMRCLRPLPNSKGKVVDPSPCRNHNGSCVHCAVFHRYMLAMRPGSTDGECQWNHGTAIHVVKTAKAVSRFGKKGMARTDALRDQIIGMVDGPNIKGAMIRAQTQRYTRGGRRVKCSFD